jgi:RNA polymerase sigma-70 factor (ECF subfamily)
MRNIWISNHRRRAGAMPSVSLDGMDEAGWPRDRGGPPGSSDVEASVVDRLSVASIHTAIEGLPPHLRQVVVLAHVEEAPYGTISETLAIPIGTVASRLSRGRRHLQRALSGELQGDGALARAG